MSENEKYFPPADEEELRRAEEDAALANQTLMEVAPDQYEAQKVTAADLVARNRRREEERARLARENKERIDTMWEERAAFLKTLPDEELKKFYQITARSLNKIPLMVDTSELRGGDEETRKNLFRAMQMNIAAEMHVSHIPDTERTLALIKNELQNRGLHGIVQELESKNKVTGQN